MEYFEIKDADIRHNIEVIRQKAGRTVWGVLKYNAYGVGLLHMAKLLQECGITHFAVSDAAELRLLRQAGFCSQDVLLLRPQSTKEEMESSLKDNAIFSVGSTAYAEALMELAQREKKTVRAHITLDTGMNRYGFVPEEFDAIRALYRMDGMKIEGIYSHFSAAALDPKQTEHQLRTYKTVVSRLRSEGIDPGMAHISNSAALFRDVESELPAVRVGSALVGRVTGTQREQTGLIRIGTLVSSICEVKHLPAGSRLGYGGVFHLRRQTDIAILPSGTKSGIPDISRKAFILGHLPTALIHDRKVHILATNGIAHSFADVTGMDVHPGDIMRMDVNPLQVDSGIERKYL